jgi:predicted RNA binding protein YcfA (HicA-like mRNA interferase family)
MVKGYYLAVTKELQAIGYRYAVNAKGSHEKWTRGGETIVVPRHLNSRFTANAILKEAGSAKRV